MKKAIFRIQVPLDNLVEFAWDWWHSEGKGLGKGAHFVAISIYKCATINAYVFQSAQLLYCLAGTPVFILGPVKYLGYTFMVTTPEILLLYQRVSCLQEVINVHELEII